MVPGIAICNVVRGIGAHHRGMRPVVTDGGAPVTA